jgi:L-threonylcarbamoyladenylate synthase
VKVFHAATLSEDGYTEILSSLRSGGVIGFPTDTAYGLGADPFNEVAIAKVFDLKRRPETKPILLLVDSIDMAKSISRPPEIFYNVAGQFWPGPLTLILPAASIPPQLTASTNTIGIRWPVAAFATALIQRFGRPVTATSANRGGKPAAVTAAEVRSEFGEGLEALIDGGILSVRGGSTVLDLTRDPAVVFRDGPISYQDLHRFLKGRIRKHIA